MARFRLSAAAKADLAHILSTSTERWGIGGRRRYAAIIASAMREIERDPNGPATRGRGELMRGLRSFHMRHVRAEELGPKVKRPVHLLYYRVRMPDLVEIVRVLHERTEPSRHIDEASED